MKKFKIIEVNQDNYKHKVIDEEGNLYNIILQFYNIEPVPQVGEYIYFSEKLFDKKLNEGLVHFSFGGLNEIYGKKITKRNIKSNVDEILVIERNNKKIYLKRFYG